MVLRMGKPGALFIWAFVCLTAFFVCQTALQAASRTVYAFSRDKGLPDRGFFGHISSWTQTPLRAIWFVTVIAILPGLLDLASAVALNAIFAMTAMALDLSYIIPIFWCAILFAQRMEVYWPLTEFIVAAGGTGITLRSTSSPARSTWATASWAGRRTSTAFCGLSSSA